MIQHHSNEEESVDFLLCSVYNREVKKDFFESKADRMRMSGFVHEGYFIDIGIPEDYKKAQYDFKGFKY